jgi:hypothetical protein
MLLQSVKSAAVLVDSSLPHRWLDAFGTDVKKYIPQAGVATASSELVGWTATETGTNTTINSVSANSLLTMTTGATDFNGYSSQLLGSPFAAVAGKPFYFGGKFSLSQATQSDFLFGLCGVDTTLTVASGGHAIGVAAGGFFFSKIDAVTDIYFNVYSAGTSVFSVAVGTMDTDEHVYECYFDGETVFAYFDGVLIGSSNTTLPVTVATPSISVRNGASAATILECGWMSFIQVNA